MKRPNVQWKHFIANSIAVALGVIFTQTYFDPNHYNTLSLHGLLSALKLCVPIIIVKELLYIKDWLNITNPVIEVKGQKQKEG